MLIINLELLVSYTCSFSLSGVVYADTYQWRLKDIAYLTKQCRHLHALPHAPSIME